MNPSLNARNLLLLVLPPLLWAGNAVVGRLLGPLIPPLTLNFLRWLFAFMLLLPLAPWVLARGSGLWRRPGRYLRLGLLSIGLYNSLQYLALETSTPVNVTLVGSSMPVFMLAVGAIFYGQRIAPRQISGAALSIAGVLVVLAHGDPVRLARVHFVAGDLYMLAATAAWAWYSWLLTRAGEDEPALRGHWAAFLLAQVTMGLGWAALFSGGEWLLLDPAPIQWGWPLAAGLTFIVIGPAVLAYRCWGLGVQRLGPNLAAIFNNLTPLFAALLSAAFVGEPPQLYHGLAFALIAAGILMGAGMLRLGTRRAQG